MGSDVTVWLSFGAGLASFISPCVLPLVPAYIGYLGGRMVAGAGSGGDRGRFGTLLHGIFFVLGFTFVFVTFGLIVSAGSIALRGAIADLQQWIAWVGGVVIIIFGLHVMGLLGQALAWILNKVPWDKLGSPGNTLRKWLTGLQNALYADTRRQMGSGGHKLGYLGSALMGVIFSAGWSPCVGPIYGAVVAMAASGSASLWQAGALLVAYSLGLGLPFLIMAAALERTQVIVRKIQRQMRLIEIVSGLFLIVIGILVFTGQLQAISGLDLGGGGTATEATSIEIGPVETSDPGGIGVGADVGLLAPNFVTQTPDGEVIELQDLRGRPVLINFWATWCEPCLEEMPDFQRAVDEHPGQLHVLAVNFRESAEEVAAFAEEHSLTFDLVLDPDNAIGRLYGVFSRPTTFIVDSDGVIVARHVALMTREQLENYLLQILP